MISAERIMGFVEGEGCFSIGIGKYIDRKPRKGGRRCNIKQPHLFRVNPSFRLTICAADRQILEEVKNTLGVGQIYEQKRALQDQKQQNIAHYYTGGLNECLRVKEFFQGQKFYTRKGHDFQLWCQCLEIIQSGRHLEKEGILALCDIRDQMNYRKTKRKRSREEIEQILDLKPLHQTAYFDEKQQKLLHNQNFDLGGWLLPKRGNCIKGRANSEMAQNNKKTPNGGV